jgi:hypothetical protein
VSLKLGFITFIWISLRVFLIINLIIKIFVLVWWSRFLWIA